MDTDNGIFKDKKSMEIGSTYVATAATFASNRVIKLGECLTIKEITGYILKKNNRYIDKQVIFTDETSVNLELFEISFEEVHK